VLRGLAAGKTYAAVAAELDIGFETVKSYAARLRAKLGVTNKVEMARWADRYFRRR